MARLLQCNSCCSLEKLLDFDGHPDNDAVLQYALKPHRFPDGEPHVGNLFTGIPDAALENMAAREQIEKELWGAKAEFAAFKDTLVEDAAACYNRHQRPKLGCIDYKDDSKRLGNPRTKSQAAGKVFLCDFCLSGDTQVVTRWGTRTIRDLASDGHGELLIPPASRGGWSGWHDVEVRSFGRQKVFEIQLTRGMAKKTVKATAEHRWVLDGGKWITTAALVPGNHLAHATAPPLWNAGSPIKPAAVGVMQGFVFGDGTKGTGNRPACVRLYGEKDKALLPYFTASEPKQVPLSDHYTDDFAWEVTGLPRAWKDPVDLAESRAHLLGWLAGYFAADGQVDKNSGRALISSAKLEHLQLVRDVCYIIGVTTAPIDKKMRLGYGKELSALYGVAISRQDLPESFWLIDEHRRRVAAHPEVKRLRWKVRSVTPSGTEEVFCAVVPGPEKFVLADNLVTGNCVLKSVHDSAQQERTQWLTEGRGKSRYRNRRR